MNYDDEVLLERARVAYAKTGALDEPGDASEVTEVDGAPYAVLRNVNGILAVYGFDGQVLKRQESWPEQIS